MWVRIPPRAHNQQHGRTALTNGLDQKARLERRHPDQYRLAVRAQPTDDQPRPSRTLRAEHPTKEIDRGGHMYVIVRVNTCGHRPGADRGMSAGDAVVIDVGPIVEYACEHIFSARSI
jgi:hypothetical protein